MTQNQPIREAKNHRLNVRVTERQERLLRRAAEVTDRSVTDFVLQTSSLEAERILTDRRWFVASAAQWQEFDRLLDEPLGDNSRLTQLARRPSQFAE